MFWPIITLVCAMYPKFLMNNDDMEFSFVLTTTRCLFYLSSSCSHFFGGRLIKRTMRCCYDIGKLQFEFSTAINSPSYEFWILCCSLISITLVPYDVPKDAKIDGICCDNMLTYIYYLLGYRFSLGYLCYLRWEVVYELMAAQRRFVFLCGWPCFLGRETSLSFFMLWQCSYIYSFLQLKLLL